MALFPCNIGSGGGSLIGLTYFYRTPPSQNDATGLITQGFNSLQFANGGSASHTVYLYQDEAKTQLIATLPNGVGTVDVSAYDIIYVLDSLSSAYLVRVTILS